MATANRTIPMSWTDSLSDVINRLEAYHGLTQAYLEKVTSETGYNQLVVNGTEALFQPVLSDLYTFVEQVNALRQFYREIDQEGGVSHV